MYNYIKWFLFFSVILFSVGEKTLPARTVQHSPVKKLFSVGEIDAKTIVRVRILEKYRPKSVFIRSLKNPKSTWQVNANTFYRKTGKKRKNYPANKKKQLTYNFVQGFQIYVNNKPKTMRTYRGKLKILEKGGQLILVNHVPLQHYIVSVVMSEMGYKPLEAMKAQAILSRTWALTHLHPKEAYDFNDLTTSQAYKGKEMENRRARQAVLETGDNVIVYQNEKIEVIYHSTCAEHTYSAKEIWGEEVPYLIVIDDKAADGKLNSVNGKHFSWDSKMNRRKVFKYLRRLYGLRKPISEIALQMKKGQWGVMLKGSNRWVPIDNFRLAVNRRFGWKKIKSNDFVIDSRKKTNKIRFYGNGYGHLVGLCQVGAGTLAQKGYSMEKILRFYYPETQILVES